MKNILKYTMPVSLLALCAGLASCSKFLDTKPISYMTPEDFVVNRAWAESSLVGVYGTFQTEYYQFDMFVNGDAASDNAYAGGDNNANFEIDDIKITATNGNVKRDWEYLYAAIGKANAFLDHIDSVQDANLPETERNRMKGEVRFMRAVHYFNLVRLWGGVPLVLKANDPSAQQRPRATVEEVYAQIREDLEYAVANLPVTVNEKGRLRKAAANGMLAKVYATQPARNWDKVLENCNAVLADAQYMLLDDYNALFDGAHENSAESLFEIQFLQDVAGLWGAQMVLPPSISGDGWKKFDTPSKELVAAFDSEGDSVRKRSSIIWEDVSGKYGDDIWGTYMPFSYKFKTSNNWNSSHNIIYLRLADVILLKAEALNEKGDIAGAAAELNRIRARVKLEPKNPATRADMRLAIEKERMLELAFEGHRWFDLKRTGRALDVMHAAGTRKPNTKYTYVTANSLLFPVPQSELDKNPALTQNPGY